MLIRIGTRQSPLALWQAEHVSARLQSFGHQVELVKITTSGDVSTTPLGQSGGQGLFTKEIQRALIDERCDLAVHSLKDLPTDAVDGLELAAVPKREEAMDCLVSQGHLPLMSLAQNARVGTGSPRRRAQLLNQRPDLSVLDIRGNVNTRLRKLDEGQYDAILLAYAGMHRLKLDSRISEKLTMSQMLPAVGQAALGLETRTDDRNTWEAVQSLRDEATHLAVLAERSLLRSMRAGCLAPLAAHAVLTDSTMTLTAKVFSLDGSKVVATQQKELLDLAKDRAAIEQQAEKLGEQAAQALIDQGADRLIQAARG